IASGQQPLGAVFIAADMNIMIAQVTSLRDRLILFGASTGLLIFVLSIFIARYITRPVNKLTQGVQEMTAGNYGAQVNIDSKDEFAALAFAFNEMSNKIAAEDQIRRQFVANASHELKSPLASMKALVEASLNGSLAEEEAKEVLGDINQEVDRLNKLVGDLLLLSRIENNKQEIRIQEVSVGELMYQLTHKLEPLARQKAISLKLVSDKELYWAMDGEMIFRAVFNLLDNAIKYSLPNTKIELGYESKGQKLSLWVEDQGIGINESDLKRIFERFYRQDKARSRETGGAGIGLAIVSEIVTLHGGQVTVKSEVGVGSKFNILLP
ncbi:MAG: HAMP domain-containing sensor histidine kinase, partial [Bacillota bacterium]|nr:HAMP domain-containing sensor histidine kinase [Bacillota bacterium]